MQIISILNQKGGSGKTTLTTNLAYAILKDNHKVLIIDSDPQGSARDWNNETDGSIVPVVGLDRPSLANDIKAVINGYDFVLIDGAPQLSKHMAAAIRVSDKILIPVQPSPYDIWATADLVGMIKQAQELGSKVSANFIITRAIANTKLAKEAVEALSGYEINVLDGSTNQRIAYPDSAASGKTVFHTKDIKAQAEILAIKDELYYLIK